jgi:hypothetical protein
VRAPQPVALAGGEGPIRITLAAALPALGPGHHRVFYRNDHHPADAAYLANALASSSPRVEIGAQRRDVDQRELTIEYTLDGREAAGVPWLLVGGLAAELTTIGGLALLFKRRRT